MNQNENISSLSTNNNELSSEDNSINVNTLLKDNNDEVINKDVTIPQDKRPREESFEEENNKRPKTEDYPLDYVIEKESTECLLLMRINKAINKYTAYQIYYF